MFKSLSYEPRDPLDRNFFSLNFLADLDAGSHETIVSAVVTAALADGTSANLTISDPTLSASMVTVRISGGVVNTNSLLSFLVTTSNSNSINRSVWLPTQSR